MLGSYASSTPPKVKSRRSKQIDCVWSRLASLMNQVGKVDIDEWDEEYADIAIEIGLFLNERSLMGIVYIPELFKLGYILETKGECGYVVGFRVRKVTKMKRGVLS